MDDSQTTTCPHRARTIIPFTPSSRGSVFKSPKLGLLNNQIIPSTVNIKKLTNPYCVKPKLQGVPATGIPTRHNISVWPGHHYLENLANLSGHHYLAKFGKFARSSLFGKFICASSVYGSINCTSNVLVSSTDL